MSGVEINVKLIQAHGRYAVETTTAEGQKIATGWMATPEQAVAAARQSADALDLGEAAHERINALVIHT